MVLEIKVPYPAIGQNDICVKDFAGERVHTARSDCRTDIVVEPSHKVILHVLGIEVHVVTCLCVLIEDFYRIRESNLFECFVPILDPLLDPTSVPHRCCMLDVESNGFNGWADF